MQLILPHHPETCDDLMGWNQGVQEFDIGDVELPVGVHLRDIDCAFKVFDGDLIRSLELSSPGALINAEIQAKARRQGAAVQQVGVRHFPRIAGEATGGNPRVIVRAMKETIVLWWKMRTYQPPPGRPNVNGPYRLGDALVVTGALSSAAIGGSVLRRLFDRKD